MPIEQITSFLCDLAESPVWAPAQRVLYWVDISGRRIHCIDPETGRHQSWSSPSEPSAIALTDRARLIVAMRSGFHLFDPLSGRFELVAVPAYDTSRMRFNDGRCDPAGRFWAGTMDEPRERDTAGWWCLDHGKLRKGPHGIVLSNGLAFARDGKTMLHADSQTGRIYRYDYDLATGAASGRELWHQFAESEGLPDGAAVDAEGHYWIAMFGAGGILRLDMNARVSGRIELPVPFPTMIAFGGPDLRTLYITTSRRNRSAAMLGAYPKLGALFAVRVDVPGLPETEYVE